MDSSTEVNDDERTIRWYSVTHSPEWDATVQDRAQFEWTKCLAVVKDRKASEADREAARCQMEIWEEIIGWAHKYEAELTELKAAQSRAAQSSDEDELVGAKAEDQWYEK